MREEVGYISNSVFNVPNLMRGLGPGLPLPFSVTMTQLALFGIFCVASFLIGWLPPLVWIGTGVAGNIIVHFLFPAAGSYLVGSKEPDGMNVFRYMKVRAKTWLEPKELIRLEEVHQAYFYRVDEVIPISTRPLRKEVQADRKADTRDGYRKEDVDERH